MLALTKSFCSSRTFMAHSTLITSLLRIILHLTVRTHLPELTAFPSPSDTTDAKFSVPGFLVVAPDYFEGDPIQVASERPTFDRSTWFKTTLPRAKLITPKWIDAVVKEYGASDWSWERLLPNFKITLGNEKTKYCTVGMAVLQSFLNMTNKTWSYRLLFRSSLCSWCLRHWLGGGRSDCTPCISGRGSLP